MHCLFCEKKISRLRNILREDTHFCSTAHRAAYAKQQSELGLAMLRQSQTQRAETDSIECRPVSKCGFAAYAVIPNPLTPRRLGRNTDAVIVSSQVIKLRTLAKTAPRLANRSAPAIDTTSTLLLGSSAGGCHISAEARWTLLPRSRIHGATGARDGQTGLSQISFLNTAERQTVLQPLTPLCQRAGTPILFQRAIRVRRLTTVAPRLAARSIAVAGPLLPGPNPASYRTCAETRRTAGPRRNVQPTASLRNRQTGLCQSPFLKSEERQTALFRSAISRTAQPFTHATVFCERRRRQRRIGLKLAAAGEVQLKVPKPSLPDNPLAVRFPGSQVYPRARNSANSSTWTMSAKFEAAGLQCSVLDLSRIPAGRQLRIPIDSARHTEAIRVKRRRTARLVRVCPIQALRPQFCSLKSERARRAACLDGCLALQLDRAEARRVNGSYFKLSSPLSSFVITALQNGHKRIELTIGCQHKLTLPLQKAALEASLPLGLAVPLATASQNASAVRMTGREKAPHRFAITMCKVDVSPFRYWPSTSHEAGPLFQVERRPWSRWIGLWTRTSFAVRVVALITPAIIIAIYCVPGTAAWGALKNDIRARAAIEQVDDFHSGLSSWEGEGNWSRSWSYDRARLVHPGKLALWRKSFATSDYQFTFTAEINSSLGWVFRASDLRNYYGCKITMARRSATPVPTLARFTVIDGRKSGVVELPIPLMLQGSQLYEVQLNVRGSSFSTTVNGQLIDHWTNERLLSGGVGFFSEPGAAILIGPVHVSFRDDFLGRFCAFLVSFSR